MKKTRRQRRRQRGGRALLAGAVVSCALLRPAGAAGAEESAGAVESRIRRFEIPAGALDAALASFEVQSGLRVIRPAQPIGNLDSPGVSGEWPAEDALRRLLAGTGVGARVEAGAIELRLQARGETVDVVVAAGPSSPKLTQALRDLPQTFTVVSAAVMGEQVATTLRDVLRNVPGISVQAGEGGVPAGDNLTIRGFSARTDIFVDGVRDFGGYFRDPFNLQQVEVAKGPASSYTGRGSTGGSVNLVSKSPTLQASRQTTLGLGADAYKRGTLDLDQPIRGTGLDGVGFRLNAMWTDSDVPGRDAVTNRRWGLAPTLSVGLGTPTRLTLGYFHLSQDNLPDYGLPWVPNTNTALLDDQDGPPPVDFENFYGLTTRDREQTATDLATVQFQRDFGARVTLRNLLRHGTTRRDSVITAPRFVSNTSTALNRQLQSRDMDDTILADQLDLTARFATGALRHAVVAGLELSRETSINHLRSGPAAPTADLLDPDPDQPYAGPITRTGAVNEAEAHSVGAYAFDTVEVGSRWQVTGGLRFDRFDVDYVSTAATGAATPLGRRDEVVSGRGAVTFKPRPHGSVYAGYGTSFNPSAEGLTLTAATASLEPERTHTLEAGTKWDLLAQRLALTAAVFHTRKTNARTPGLDAGDPPTVLEGEQQVQGVELGVSGSLGSRCDVFGGYTFLDSEVLSSNTAAEIGHEVGNTPRHSVSLWASTRLPAGLELGAGAFHVGRRFNANSGRRVAPAYWRLDATASYQVHRRLTLRLNASNLLDEEFIDRVGGGHFIPGNGRTASLTAELKF